MRTTQALLRQAKQNGADRIYGWNEKIFCESDKYTLKAVDGNGKIYFRRTLAWPAYLEAVTYWQQLNAMSWNVFKQLEEAS